MTATMTVLQPPALSVPATDERPPVDSSPVAGATAQVADQEAPLITADAVSVFYGNFEAIKKVSVAIPRNRVVAFIGPSGCGKSTFLRSINRINDLIPGCRVTGELKIGGRNIYDRGVDLVSLRRQVGLDRVPPLGQPAAPVREGVGVGRIVVVGYRAPGESQGQGYHDQARARRLRDEPGSRS